VEVTCLPFNFPLMTLLISIFHSESEIRKESERAQSQARRLVIDSVAGVTLPDADYTRNDDGSRRLHRNLRENRRIS